MLQSMGLEQGNNFSIGFEHKQGMIELNDGVIYESFSEDINSIKKRGKSKQSKQVNNQFQQSNLWSLPSTPKQ